MESARELVDLFIGNNDVPKYIFGRNQYAKTIRTYVKLSGVIDEFTSDDSYHGIPIVHSLSKVERDAIVLNLIFGIRPLTIQRRIEGAGLRCIDFFTFSKYSGLTLPISFWNGFQESYASNKEDYETLANRLADEKSKDIFQRLMNLRLNLDYSSLSIFEVNEKEQYFEPFLDLKEEGESFVDVGGFDGNTSLEFIKRCPKYDKIYFFEPEPDIMAKARNNQKGYSNITYCQVAASNKKGVLHFSSNESASKVSNDGDIVIQADTIDSQIKTPVTFIKMDIEGSESLAIEGAKETIRKYHPRLAICVYHRGGDYIDIPKQVLKIRDDYDIYLRHYTEGVTETVMFFIPKEEK